MSEDDEEVDTDDCAPELIGTNACDTCGNPLLMRPPPPPPSTDPLGVAKELAVTRENGSDTSIVRFTVAPFKTPGLAPPFLAAPGAGGNGISKGLPSVAGDVSAIGPRFGLAIKPPLLEWKDVDSLVSNRICLTPDAAAAPLPPSPIPPPPPPTVPFAATVCCAAAKGSVVGNDPLTDDIQVAKSDAGCRLGAVEDVADEALEDWLSPNAAKEDTCTGAGAPGAIGACTSGAGAPETGWKDAKGS